MSREMRESDGQGFAMVEVVVSLIIFALLALALLPILIQGQQLAGRQSAEATATRQISALIDSIRANPTCTQVSSVLGTTSYTDGSGRAYTVTTTVSPTIGSCTNNMTVKVSFNAANTGSPLSSATALVYIP